ncbi:unnamed protein product (macronuclear) [Paramecium tetraurelia]|uniref:Uncharacterized protein n=1 Tax=Paramecium tetraurelia TaxID=5888 RepID=A0BTE0_PARTE|nr:uncharacterized protein GSPATT00032039001 [Paramecium tetraurelia]CAK61807.1 unnamed protein product [Paramecium tetraurelia]|eukprot:XP_001429205.1 hypothetical protein (macronuclear) [Paramecium tetraurelia strain d4-2]
MMGRLNELQLQAEKEQNQFGRTKDDFQVKVQNLSRDLTTNLRRPCKKKNQQLKQEIINLQQQIAQKHQQYSEQKSQADAQINKLNIEISKLKTDLAVKQQQLESSEQQFNQYKMTTTKQIDSMIQQFEQRQNEISLGQ